MIPQLTNHVWQSTLFAGAAGLLTVAFRKNRAHLRFWLWFSASVKFFAPFSLLIGLGRSLAPAGGKIAAPALSLAVEQITEPFSGVATFVPATPHSVSWIPLVVLGVWACGFVAIAAIRLRDWLRIRATVRCSMPLDIASEVDVRSASVASGRLLEPGVFGLWRPTLLLPAGIEERLTPLELEAVLAHELCHVRRRDNLFASIHMLVEAMFWFHPLVWWIGGRLVEERERACDEHVLRLGSEPQVYATAILNVCKLYVESPLECVAGVTGSDLKRRIEAILTNPATLALNGAKKWLLASAAAAAVVVPLAIGVGHAQPEKPLAFDAASIKPVVPSGGGRGSFGGGIVQIKPPLTVQARMVNARRIILEAYHLTDQKLSGGPGWLDSAWFSLDAKAASPSTTSQLRQMLQTLLAERFRLVVHRETREMPVFVLTVAKSGLKVPELKEGDPTPTHVSNRTGAPGPALAYRAKMDDFARLLSGNPSVDRPVIDKTGLSGVYFFGVQWAPDEDFLTVVQQEFGLKVESQRLPMDVLVIDRIERPSEN